MGNVAVKMMMFEYIGFLRMIQLWFHGTHHLTRGTGFSGDHVNLYSKIYTSAEEQFDGAVEKGIGLLGDELGCPIHITEKTLEIMSEYPSPIELKSAGQAAVGLQIEKDFLKFSQNFYDSLKQMGAMTLGLDDMIMANANAHESNAYLLQQRIKSALDY